MLLKSYYGKHVRITDEKGYVYIGSVTDYFFGDDNESGVDSIVLETSGGDLYEFTANNIVEITVI